MPHSKTVHFIIGRPLPMPSLDPMDSDSLTNALYVEQLVGTLVRLSPSGRYEGYLAESWDIDEEKKTWTFFLRPSLKCENGTEITAPIYKKGLELVLKNFLQYTDIPLLSNLKGLSDFKKGSLPTIEGIHTPSENKISFAFDKLPQSGFLEYLGLPFLGFFCPSNFSEQGTWKDRNHIVSSGAFKIEKWDEKGPIVLRARHDWPTFKSESAESIFYYRQTVTKDVQNLENHVVLSFDDTDKNHLGNDQEIQLLPTTLNAVVLSPDSNSIFKTKENRTVFLKQLSKVRLESPFTLPSGKETNTFYPELHLSSAEDTKIDGSKEPQKLISKKLIKILAPEKPGPHSAYIKKILEMTLENLGLAWEYIPNTNSQVNLMKHSRNTKIWDIKIAIVDIGGGIENQLVKFMFCSKLGISFPDPSGNICKLVDEYEKRYGEAAPKDAMTTYMNKFDEIIREDAAVVPILKSGKKWYLSKTLDPDFISPTTSVPYFDLLKIK